MSKRKPRWGLIATCLVGVFFALTVVALCPLVVELAGG